MGSNGGTQYTVHYPPNKGAAVGWTQFWLLWAGAAFASPVAAVVCFWKDKWVLAMAGVAALPAAGLTFVLANNELAKLDDSGEIIAGIFFGIVLMLVIAVLAIPSLFGAVRLARPNSRWATTLYDEDKMNRALTRAAHDFFGQLGVPKPPQDNDNLRLEEPPSDPYPPSMDPPALTPLTYMSLTP